MGGRGQEGTQSISTSISPVRQWCHILKYMEDNMHISCAAHCTQLQDKKTELNKQPQTSEYFFFQTGLLLDIYCPNLNQNKCRIFYFCVIRKTNLSILFLDHGSVMSSRPIYFKCSCTFLIKSFS